MAPDLPVQLIHQDDVAAALRLCVVAAGPPGAYNIAADDVVNAADVLRELGFLPLAVPGKPVAAVARAISSLPFLPSGMQWVEAMSHPAIMDTTKARTELGWARSTRPSSPSAPRSRSSEEAVRPSAHRPGRRWRGRSPRG